MFVYNEEIQEFLKDHPNDWEEYIKDFVIVSITPAGCVQMSMKFLYDGEWVEFRRLINVSEFDKTISDNLLKFGKNYRGWKMTELKLDREYHLKEIENIDRKIIECLNES